MRISYHLIVALTLISITAPVIAQTPPPATPGEEPPPAVPNPISPDVAVQPHEEPELAPVAPAQPPPEPQPVPGPELTPPGVAPSEVRQEPTPVAVAVPATQTQLRIDLPNSSSIRFGLLSQLQYEGHGNAANDDFVHNLFLRRFAVIIGGTLFEDFEYFFDTDFGDLFKANGDESLKSGPGISAKDAFVTYKGLGDVFKIDGGLLMPPLSHNVLQGGGSLYSWDFFFNTFRHAAAFGSTDNSFGRDVGVQFRGLVLDGHLEYRTGVFQGRRQPAEAGPPARLGSRNPFRFAGRVQINILDPETNYFYAGTYLGTKRILSFGASYDFQPDEGSSYKSWSVDGFLDLPLGPGSVTAQVDLVYRDGDELVVLPKQTFLGAEAGYRFDAVKLSPIVRVERRWGPGTALDETDLSAGLAFWAFGHNSNLKAFYTRLIPADPANAFDQFNLQWQLAFY
jgi:hypothetical protein